MPFLSPNQQCQSAEGEKYHIPWTCLSQAHLGVFQLCLWPLTAPGYLGGGLLCLSSPLWCQYSINILIYLFEKIHWTPSLYSGIMPVICQYDWCTKKCQSLVSEWFSSRQLWIDSGQLNWRCQLTNFDFSLAAFRYFDTGGGTNSNQPVKPECWCVGTGDLIGAVYKWFAYVSDPVICSFSALKPLV